MNATGARTTPNIKIPRLVSENVWAFVLGWHVCRTKLARKIFSRHEFSHDKCSEIFPEIQGPLNGGGVSNGGGGVSNRGVSRSGLVLPFLSFFVLFGAFPIFPGFSRFARGWSPDFSFSSFSAYEQHLRGTVDLSRKKVGNPLGLETPQCSFSQEMFEPHLRNPI